MAKLFTTPQTPDRLRKISKTGVFAFLLNLLLFLSAVSCGSGGSGSVAAGGSTATASSQVTVTGSVGASGTSVGAASFQALGFVSDGGGSGQVTAFAVSSARPIPLCSSGGSSTMARCAPLKSAPVSIVQPTAAGWQSVPGIAPVTTDGAGNFSITFDIGKLPLKGAAPYFVAASDAGGTFTKMSIIPDDRITPQAFLNVSVDDTTTAAGLMHCPGGVFPAPSGTICWVAPNESANIQTLYSSIDNHFAATPPSGTAPATLLAEVLNDPAVLSSLNTMLQKKGIQPVASANDVVLMHQGGAPVPIVKPGVGAGNTGGTGGTDNTNTGNTGGTGGTNNTDTGNAGNTGSTGGTDTTNSTDGGSDSVDGNADSGDSGDNGSDSGSDSGGGESDGGSDSGDGNADSGDNGSDGGSDSGDGESDGGDSGSGGTVNSGGGTGGGVVNTGCAITVTAGTTPTYSWTIGNIFSLSVKKAGSAVWAITTTTDAIASPVTHGIPAGARETVSLEPVLVSGARYTVSIAQLGSQTNCSRTFTAQ